MLSSSYVCLGSISWIYNSLKNINRDSVTLNTILKGNQPLEDEEHER